MMGSLYDDLYDMFGRLYDVVDFGWFWLTAAVSVIHQSSLGRLRSEVHMSASFFATKVACRFHNIRINHGLLKLEDMLTFPPVSHWNGQADERLHSPQIDTEAASPLKGACCCWVVCCCHGS